MDHLLGGRTEPVVDINPLSGERDLEIGREVEFELPDGTGLSVLAYNERSSYPTIALINLSDAERVVSFGLYPRPDMHISTWHDIDQPAAEVAQRRVGEDEAKNLDRTLRSIIESLEADGRL